MGGATNLGLSDISKCKMQVLSCVQLFATPWTVTHQAPLSMEFSRQEYCTGLLFPSLRDLPDPEIEPLFPTLADRFFITEPPGKRQEASELPQGLGQSGHQRGSQEPRTDAHGPPGRRVPSLKSLVPITNQ